MTNYNKLIIFIAFLIIFSASVIYLYGPDDAVNKMMPDIGSDIAAGDSDYNEAVDLLNGKNYDEAKNKAISAGNNFNHTHAQLVSIRDNFTSQTDDVHKNYIDTLLSEIELKINATDYLLDSIDCYESYQNATGNEYSYQANEYMQDAIEFQNARNSIVNDNPNLFK